MPKVLSLEQHGWSGCSVPLVLDHGIDQLPTWKNLRVLRPPEMYGSRKLQIPYESINDSNGIYTHLGTNPSAKQFLPAIQYGTILDEGSYGTIWKADRAIYKPAAIEGDHEPNKNVLERVVEFFEIVSKVSPVELSDDEMSQSDEKREEYYAEEIQAILHEATLHVLAYHTLASKGYSTAVPELFDVFATASDRTPTHASQISKIHIQMEFVEGDTLHRCLNKRFTESIVPHDMLLIDILIQLSIYLEILQKNLFFNHRDLKTNNVLLRKHSPTWKREFKHPALPTPWIGRNDLVIIDFGFSCLAYGVDNPKSIVQAGCWFRKDHDCLKEGRDLALFLYCLHACFPLQKRISADLWKLLRTATTVEFGGRTFSILEENIRTDGKPSGVKGPITFSEGIYRFLRKDEVNVSGCKPAALLATLGAFVETHGRGSTSTGTSHRS
jgi:serine/threonine protein kinase